MTPANRMAHALLLEERTVIDPTANPNPNGEHHRSSTPLAAGSSPSLNDSTGTRASTGNGDERIRRFAGTVHRAIDSIEQRLSSAGGGISSAQARYGEQARQYGDRLRARISDQPLQSAGIVLASGVLLDRLFLRKPKVRVVKMLIRTRSTGIASPRTERRTHGWSDAADARLQRVGGPGEHAAAEARVAAALGIAGTKARVSDLTREANALPLKMRMTTQRLMARSQEYGAMARSTVGAHPWAALGAVLAASGLLTALLMRRQDAWPVGRDVAVDERGTGTAWRRWSQHDTRTGPGEMTMLRRRME